MDIKSVTRSPNLTQTKINPIHTDLKCKKYYTVVQNISRPKVLLAKPKWIIGKPENIQKTDMNVKIHHKYKYLKHKYVLQIFSSMLILK